MFNNYSPPGDKYVEEMREKSVVKMDKFPETIRKEACDVDVTFDSVTKSNTNVGYSSLPKQCIRANIRNGFNFNIMIAGMPGLGKSTFVNTLLRSYVYSQVYPSPSVRSKQEQSCNFVAVRKLVFSEGNVSITVEIVDFPGFGESLDNTFCWKPLVDEINRRNLEYMHAEMSADRHTKGSGSAGRIGVLPDRLIHVCFYFLSPNLYDLHPIDLETLRHIGSKVNVIPLIAKADTMTTEECQHYKKLINNLLLSNGVQLYEFPINILIGMTNVADKNIQIERAKAFRLRRPFAICTSNQEMLNVSGQKIRCRFYPWGIVETDNLEHNDFHALQTLVMRFYMQDLIDATHNNFFANYRSNAMTIQVEECDEGLFSGRHPLCQLEVEKIENKVNLKEHFHSMEEICIQKIRERENRLRLVEAEVKNRIKCMKRELQAGAEDLAFSRKTFLQMRLSWERNNSEKIKIFNGKRRANLEI